MIQNNAEQEGRAASSPTLGTHLRALRQARGLTLDRAAAAAGIGRVTLNRWETSTHTPRLPELESLLRTLDAGPQQRLQALALVEAPRAQAQMRAEMKHRAEQVGMGPLPHRGELLRAMRLRCEMSLDAAAAAVGVSLRTLRRWESGEVWPGQENLHILCRILGARAEESLALTSGPLSGPGEFVVSGTSLETLEGRLLALSDLVTNGGSPCIELSCLSFEAQAWPHALRSEEGRRLLAHAYTLRALHLDHVGYTGECSRVAERALSLLPSTPPQETFWVRAAMFAANAHVLSGVPRRVEQGRRQIASWLPLMKDASLEAWAVGQMGMAFALSGGIAEAKAAAARACQIAERTGVPEEAARRRYDQAGMLLLLGEPTAAADILDRVETGVPYFRTHLAFAKAKTYLEAGRRSEGQSWLERTMREIEAFGLDGLRPVADSLARRF